MKKALIIAIFVVATASILSSCKPYKPPCPAYNTHLETEQNTDDV